MTQLKVCGLTRPEDVEACLALEVDALGFNFVPGTPRALEFELAQQLCELARGRARCVGVFQDAPLGQLLEQAERLGLDCVQLHGAEPPEYASAIGWPVIKVLAGDPQGIEGADLYPRAELLIDHPSGGGSGRSWKLELALKLVEAGRQVWIAGGLGPDNVASAIRSVWPFGVDACSGLESAPGVKSREKLERFVSAARAVEAGVDQGRSRSQSA